MLTVHHSNQLETLAHELAALTREPLASAFASEVIVVQSRGVARWLSLALAERNGVCANVRFPFPNAYAWELYRAVCGNVPEQSAFDPDVLTWRILDVLPALERSSVFAPVKHYVGGDDLRRYELAARLAALYDEYLVYRPDWIDEWERRDEPKHWQAALWRRLAKDAGTPHRAALHAQLLQTLASPPAAPAATIPQRVSVFGAPALPPTQLELFHALSRHRDVHLFVQNPCREYWGDIAGEGEIARKTLARAPDAAYLQTGNRLLASLGKQARDFIDLLASVEGEAVQAREHFVEPAHASLLGSIQSGILNLHERPPDAPRTRIAPDDPSVQIHCCHSAMREVEVLHDRLLALFSSSPDLEPADVVVMTPDIESYAPYIEAVFGTAEPRIPFSISDRSAEHASTLAETFIALLELPGSRYDANRVLAALDEPAVRRRFGLGEGDLETVRRWVRDSQIRWGIDGAHRARFGVPATHEHTWRFGLDRLLLGYALPAGGERLYEGVLPYDEVEGSLGRVLGRFQSFAEGALALDTQLAGTRPVARWCELLQALIVRFFDPDEAHAEELESVRAGVAAIEAEARRAGYAGPVPLAVVTSVLRARLEVPGRAFLSGGVTFCAMVPMRSLPFEVVCMIGMNDGAYPRMRRRDGFDLMAGDFRKGDRSRRDDDRYLFLESILSARRCAYLSYTGRHIRDDTVIPPSVLVSELLDYVRHGYDAADGEDIVKRLVTVHPLQAFSRRYFEGDERLFSYSRALAKAASLAGRGERQRQPLIVTGLPAPDVSPRTVDLATLIRFFRNPARDFVAERLGIRLEEAEEEIEPHEPFALDTLDGYGLKQRLLERHLTDATPGEARDALALAHAAGLLPHGGMGDALFEREDDAVKAFARKLAPLLGLERMEPLTLGTDCGHLKLVGTLAGVTPAGLLLYRAAKATVNDRLGAWIRHLALNALRPAGIKCETRVVAQDCMLVFAEVAEARERLRELLEIYCEGQRRPLHFFPKTACEYAKSWEITQKVVAAWEGSDYRAGERDENAYYRLAFRAGYALDEVFERLARAVLMPMNAVLEETKTA